MIERLLKENQKSSLSSILKIKLKGQKLRKRTKLKNEGNEN
jgi:hypothetical protein